MKGNPRVLENLQMLLNNELAARDQYFLHSRIFKDYGLNKLFDHINHEMEHETEHADLIMERILFLEALPDMNCRDQVKIGTNVLEMLENDLDCEYGTADKLRSVIKICEEEKDYETRKMLVQQLDDTEMDHAYWLEKQIRLINQVGIENYVQSQIGDASET